MNLSTRCPGIEVVDLAGGTRPWSHRWKLWFYSPAVMVSMASGVNAGQQNDQQDAAYEAQVWD
jgi:hypothetical protein